MDCEDNTDWKTCFEKEQKHRRDVEHQLEAKIEELYQTQYTLKRKIQELEALNQKLLLAEKGERKSAQEKAYALEELTAFTEALEDMVEERTQEAHFQKLKIIQSLNYAKQIQLAILSFDEKVIKNLPEHFIFFKPRDIVSGDMYWFSNKHPDLTFIAVVDCTGHGVPGAFMSLIAHNLLNEIINIRRLFSVEQALEKLHKLVVRVLKQKVTNNHDGMDVSLVMIDSFIKRIDFAGANASMVMIQNQEQKIINGERVGIGGIKINRQRNYSKKTFSYSKKYPTHLYLFSDGFQDQFGGKIREKFLRQRFYELLLEIHTLPMSAQRLQLENTLKVWMNGQPNNEQTDDILVMGLRLIP
ncbi:hypothetical protein BKI52_01535 [marine bacterium AO1-C]|nr:hypothetical protein BKI52_01535 [marine bacterium AO1-C]